MEFPIRWLISGLYRRKLYHDGEPVILRGIIDFLMTISYCQYEELYPKNVTKLSIFPGLFRPRQFEWAIIQENRFSGSLKSSLSLKNHVTGSYEFVDARKLSFKRYFFKFKVYRHPIIEQKTWQPCFEKIRTEHFNLSFYKHIILEPRWPFLDIKFKVF